MDEILRHSGIDKLYRHQSEALDYIRSGRHVVVATPTASGKTLIYNLPVFEKILRKNETKALYLFPLKALAQDQHRTFSQMASFFNEATPRAEIYDGDTTTYRRKRIRETPPSWRLIEEAMDELIAVARAEGVEMGEEDRQAGVRGIRDMMPPTWRGSLVTDLEAGRRLEVEWLHGTICRLGEKHGIDTPFHRVVLGALMPHANGAV